MGAPTFMEKLATAWRQNDSLACVGLDPDPERLPAGFDPGEADVLAFCRAIVDATGDQVCAFKPQIAHFAALGAEAALEGVIAHIRERFPNVPVILDAKRGDIGSTAARYATEAFERYGADAVTVNPYLGFDSVEPFLARADRGVVILCRTSNAGAGDFQDLAVDGRALYEHVAAAVAGRWNQRGNCMLVVGATWPEQLRRVRELVGDMPLLVPGVGSQGGDLGEVVRVGQDASGTGLVINAARSILYADAGPGFAAAAREKVREMKDAINAQRAGR